MSIPYIKTLLEFSSITSKPSQLTLVQFTASWCGPCKAIAPKADALSKVYKDKVAFYKVDVDEAQEIAQANGVTAMPTFILFKGANKLDEMKGANPQGLEAMLKKHANVSSAPAEKGLEGFASLNSAIDPQVTCLNESTSHGIKEMLKGGGDKWLESDSDEQLLLQLPMQASRIRAIRFTTVPSKLAHAPKTVRLFVNKPQLGFDDAESLEPAQELTLTEAQAKGEEAVQLRYVRFQTVTTLSVFVVDNQGEEDVSRIDKLEVIGVLVDGTDMSKLEKGEHDHDH